MKTFVASIVESQQQQQQNTQQWLQMQKLQQKLSELVLKKNPSMSFMPVSMKNPVKIRIQSC